MLCGWFSLCYTEVAMALLTYAILPLCTGVNGGAGTAPGAGVVGGAGAVPGAGTGLVPGGKPPKYGEIF